MAQRPPSDDKLDRDAFYDSAADEPEYELADDGHNKDATAGVPADDPIDLADIDGDDDEYELEPVDAEILESERQRAKEELVRAETSLDIDEVYKDQSAGTEEIDEYFKQQFEGFQFRFQVKHLLMGTAALAVVLSLGKLTGSGFAVLMMLVFVSLVAANVYLSYRDRQREQALAAKRERLVALAREGESGAIGVEGPSMYDEELEEDTPPERPPLKFQFTVKQVLVTMTVASIVFGVLSLFGAMTGAGINFLAAVLGLVAIAGLVTFAVGVELPAVVALGWWLVLLLYVIVSVAGAMMGGGSGGP